MDPLSHISFLLLFTIPIWVQVVTICDRLDFYKWFSVLFNKLYCILQVVWGLYRSARECHRLQKPARQLQTSVPRPSQQLAQTSPPSDEHIFASMTRPIPICLAEESHILASWTSQEILAPQQDRASEEAEIVTPQEPLTSATEQHSISDTPIHQVEPVLGTTPAENMQLQNRNQPQDITDILGTAAFKGYIKTPIQALNGINVKQPKWFFPLAKEAEHLAEEI